MTGTATPGLSRRGFLASASALGGVAMASAAAAPQVTTLAPFEKLPPNGNNTLPSASTAAGKQDWGANRIAGGAEGAGKTGYTKFAGCADGGSCRPLATRRTARDCEPAADRLPEIYVSRSEGEALPMVDLDQTGRFLAAELAAAATAAMPGDPGTTIGQRHERATSTSAALFASTTRRLVQASRCCCFPVADRTRRSASSPATRPSMRSKSSRGSIGALRQICATPPAPSPPVLWKSIGPGNPMPTTNSV